MKHENLPGGITRRSFIKRSVVAAVAVSNITVLSGLVNANLVDPPYGYSCTVEKWDGWFGDGRVFPPNQQVPIKFCRVKYPNCTKIVTCGRFYKRDNNGHVQLGENGQPMTEPVTWVCYQMEPNPFHGPEFPNEPAVVPVLKMCLP